MKREKFFVTFKGGQYGDYWHNAETITASTWRGLFARVNKLRKEKEEYWDNWAGWHKPIALIMLDSEPTVLFNSISSEAVFPKNDIPKTGNKACSRYEMAKYYFITDEFRHEDDGVYISTAAKNFNFKEV